MFSAGTAADGGGVAWATVTTGLLLADLESAIGTATIATSSTTASGHSLLPRRSVTSLEDEVLRMSVSSFIARESRRPPAAVRCCWSEWIRSGCWSWLGRSASPR